MIKSIHKQVYKHIESSDTVIMFIHGFSESPKQFKFLNKIAVANGLSYVNILLPGHGDTYKEFFKTNYKKWINYVDRELEYLNRVYKKIVIVGHSMGCLFAINSCAKNKYNIIGIFNINTPFNIKVGFKTFLEATNMFINPKKSETDFIRAVKEEKSIEVTNNFCYIFWLPRYIELFILVYKTYFNIRKVKVPSIYLQSYKDGLVSIKSAFTLKKIIKKNNLKSSIIIILKNSTHFNYNVGDKDKIEKVFKAFLNKYILKK